MFFIGLTILSDFINANSLSAAPLKANSLSCISMKNEECKTRPHVLHVNGDEPVFFPFSTETSKCMVVVIILTIHMQKFVLLML